MRIVVEHTSRSTCASLQLEIRRDLCKTPYFLGGVMLLFSWLVVAVQKLVGYAMTERPQLCRDQDSNLGCLGHNEKY